MTVTITYKVKTFRTKPNTLVKHGTQLNTRCVCFQKENGSWCVLPTMTKLEYAHEGD